MKHEKNEFLIQAGKKLRKLREKKGISQEKFAEECKVHRTYVGSVERGEVNISLLVLKRFCDALETNIKNIF